MNRLVKSMVVLGFLALIQSAVGQAVARNQAPLSLADLVSSDKTSVQVADGSMQFKNTISGDTTSAVDQIMFIFYREPFCTDDITVSNITGRDPLPFIENTTISINPLSIYTAAIHASADPRDIRSAGVIVLDNSESGGMFNDAGGRPCFAVTCDPDVSQCTTSDGVDLIVSKT